MFHVGQVYSALKKDDFAEAWYVKAIHTKPDHVPALLTLAKHLGRTVSLQPTNVLESVITINFDSTIRDMHKF